MLCIMHQLEGKPIWNTSFLSCFFLFRSSSYYCSLLGSQNQRGKHGFKSQAHGSFLYWETFISYSSIASLPHEALRELSLKYGPLMHLQLGEISTVVVSSRDTAKEIMKTHDLAFVERPQVSPVGNIFTYGGTDVAFAPYGDYWRQMGKIFILELLSAKKVQSFSYVREDEVVVNDVFR